VYNLAAQSHVKVSFETPCYTAETDAFGVLSVLETILQYPIATRDRIRFYQASTSEMFGSSPSPQNEDTPFHPRSPYGVAKLYAHWIVRNYRESYGLKACSGILFNHESERRGLNFVTHKVTQAVARYSLYLAQLHAPHTVPDISDGYDGYGRGRGEPAAPAPLAVGNLEARRDWGYAPDYVRAMIAMVRKSATDPQDYVIATGVSHTIRELISYAFSAIGVVVAWEGAGLAERGYDAASRELLVTIDERYFRPAEVADLLGDARRAAAELGWRPTVSFADMIVRMVRADIADQQRAAR
jgi:GDPmannose 4,6-dehydratase